MGVSIHNNPHRLLNLNGSFVNLRSNCFKLSVDYPLNIISMHNTFSESNRLRHIDLSELSVQNLRDASGIFEECSGLEKVNIRGFEIKRAVNIKNMFSGCTKLDNLDISEWDTSSVENMRSMFLDVSS